MNLRLTFYGDAKKFLVEYVQPEPKVDEEPDYVNKNPTPTPSDDPDPEPTPPAPIIPKPEEPTLPRGEGGIILQIGANFGEILEVPQFYISARALGLDGISIATQEKAWQAMDVLHEAVNRVSGIRGEYGALQNRLEHNINDLSQATENISSAESRIRDADVAEEYTRLIKLNIIQQSVQAMMAHNNEDAGRVLQLLR